ncbi:hypothetical protein [Streptomyces kronopolitis]|uniref:hypothetical protein n=1 Tax=Streptomyces kronopolitis TaxID=1612435 RepID=UPI0020C01826|nr:hypothetical protein [Streptomyces kronopolitis]MCL6302940.1 hypothetical protein [Streptomyces kronopolitis]
MAAAMVRTPHQATNDVRIRLDDALRRAGFDAAPSMVTKAEVEGVKVNRVRIPALSLTQTQWLARKLGGQVARSDQPTASAVRKELDGALRAAGVTVQPSSVVVVTLPGHRENRVVPPSLSIGQVARIAKILEAGSTQDVREKNQKKNKESSSGSDSGKNTGRKG